MSEKNDNKESNVLKLTVVGSCNKCGFEKTVEGDFVDDNSPSVSKRKNRAYGSLTKVLQLDHAKRCQEKLVISHA